MIGRESGLEQTGHGLQARASVGACSRDERMMVLALAMAAGIAGHVWSVRELLETA